MIIAINARMLFKKRLDGIGRLSYEVIKRLALLRPNDQIYCIYDRTHKEYYNFGSNVHHVAIGLPARHPILWKLWFDYSIPNFLNKIKADCFVSLDGYNTLSSGLPSIIFGHDIAPLHFPQHMKWSHRLYYRRYLPLFLKKAHAIIANSAFTKKDIRDTLQIQGDKIHVACSGRNDYFKSLSREQVGLVRAKYTDGQPYFIFTGTRSPRKNLVRLIAAFDQVKKEHNVDHHLLIVGRSGWKDQSVIDQYRSSDYKDSIQLLESIDDLELAKLVGAADSTVFVSLYEGFGLPIIEAMACNVPVVTSDVSSMPEVAGDAALIVDPYDINAIAQAMYRSISDQQLRAALITIGAQRHLKFNWDDQANKVDELIDLLVL